MLHSCNLKSTTIQEGHLAKTVNVTGGGGIVVFKYYSKKHEIHVYSYVLAKSGFKPPPPPFPHFYKVVLCHCSLAGTSIHSLQFKCSACHQNGWSTDTSIINSEWLCLLWSLYMLFSPSSRSLSLGHLAACNSLIKLLNFHCSFSFQGPPMRV